MAEVLPLKNFPRKHTLIGNGGNSGGGGGGYKQKKNSFNLKFVTDFVDLPWQEKHNNYRTLLLISILFSPLFTYFSVPDFFISLPKPGAVDFRGICYSLKTPFHRNKDNDSTHRLIVSAVLPCKILGLFEKSFFLVQVFADQAPCTVQHRIHI